MASEYALAAQVQNVEFVRMFNEEFAGLRQLLNVVTPAKMAAGSTLTTYKSSGTLELTQVDPCAEITVSEYETNPSPVTLAPKKFRKQTAIEDILSMGYEPAAANTDRALVSDIEKTIRAAVIGGLASGSGTATGTSFQICAANAWGKLNQAMDGAGATPVFFCNPLDAAAYLGTAQVTMQTAFGLSYIENFLGLGTLVIDANVPATKIYATAQENILFAYADMTSAQGFDFYADAEGVIGVSHEANITHGALETVAICGIAGAPVFADRVIVGTIGA